MAAASIKGSHALRIALVGSEQAQQREEEEEEVQHRQTQVSVQYRGDMNNSDKGKGDSDDAGAGLPEAALDKDAADLGRRKDGELLKQPGSLAAAVAAVADAYARRTTEAVGEEKEEQDAKQPNERLHGREQTLLWNVKKGLAPIAAVDSCSGGESALETPSSAAAGSLTKLAACLEEETPRTSIPSVEVSPTNNFYAWQNCISLCAPSTTTSFNSTSSSSTSSPSRADGADDADGSEGSCFLTAAAQTRAEIRAAAIAVASRRAADLSDAPAASTTGITKYPTHSATTTETVPIDLSGNNSAAGRVKASILVATGVAGAAASNIVGTKLAPQQLATTAGDAAAVLSSPAALSLLATPCPVGDAGFGGSLCSTDPEVASVSFQDAAESTNTPQRPADKIFISLELRRTESTAAMDVEVAAAEGVVATAESSVQSMIHLQRGTKRNAAAQRCDSEGVQKVPTESQLQEEDHQRLLLEGSSDMSGLDSGAARFSSNVKEGWQASLIEGSDADLTIKTQETESFAAEDNLVVAREKDTAATAAEKDAATLAGSAAVSEESDGVVGSPPSNARASGTADRRGDSLSPWTRSSQLKAAVGEDVSSALTSSSPAGASSRLLCQEQQHLGLAANEDSSDVFKDASVAVAPLSACCTDLSTSPFAAAFKCDISPVSCCSSSSTASATSPTSIPLSSASCGGTLPIAATGSPAEVAPSDSAAADTRDTAAATPPESTGEEGSGGVTVKDSETTPASIGDTRDNNIPTWCVGFRLPLGAEGRQVLLRRLRRAYHAAPPTTRDAVLASHGLYFSRVPFATVSDLFKLSHLLGVFDFAVQCSHEFGGSGAAGSSTAAGGGGAHGSRKNNHHSRNFSRNSNTNQRQLCSGTGNTGEERKVPGSRAEAVTDSPTQANFALQVGVAPAVAAAAGSQRKNTGGTTTSKASAAGGHKNCGGAKRKGKAPEQMYPAESGVASRGIIKERAAAAAVGFEGDLVVSPGNARDGATGRGCMKTRDGELHAVLKEAAAARSRCPQQRRNPAGRSSACRAAGRQQQSPQQRQTLLKEMEAGAAAGCRDGCDSSNRGESQDWSTRQHLFLQQLSQAGVEDQSKSNGSWGIQGRNTADDIVALLSGELGKAASALLLPSAGGGRSAPKENQVAEQLLPLQLEEFAKTASSCGLQGTKTDDSPLESRDDRVEHEQRQQQALQCLLTEALRAAGIRGPQQRQHVIAGGSEKASGGCVGGKRSCRPADTVLQHEERQRCARVSFADAAGKENAWEKQSQEAPVKAQPAPAAELLPFLTSAADQLRSNNCCAPPVEVAAVESYNRGSLKAEGKIQSEAEVHECRNNSSSSGSSFDWKRFLLENYLGSVREHQQQPQHRRQKNAVVCSMSGPSTPAATRTDVIPTPTCAAAVAARDHPQPEEILQEEEIIRLPKRLRTTRAPVAASLNADASPSVTSAGFSAAAAATSGHEPHAAPAATVGRAAPSGKDGCSQAYTIEEAALLSALMTTSGSSPGDQQQRRWTLSTVEEITHLLLQLNNSSSGTVAGEEAHRAEMGQCTNRLHPKDGLYDDGGCKPSSCSCNSPCSSNPPCSRGTNNSIYCSSNTISCSSTGKDSSSFGCNTGGRCSPPLTNDRPSTESMCIPTSLTERTPIDRPVMPHHHGATGATYATVSQPKTRSMPTYAPQERCGVLSSPRESSISAAVEQLQHELSRRSGALSRGCSGSRNDCSHVATTGSYKKNRGQIGMGSNNCRDAYTDVFSQLMSQLQLLSAQVLQQQEAQLHLGHDRVSDEQQYDPCIQAQQVYESLQRRMSGPCAITPITTAAAQEETVAPGSGRLCSAEKATEYAASVQLLQLVELLQVQQRVSKLLSLFPKAQTAGSPLSNVSTLLAAASPSPSSSAVTALPAPAGSAAPVVAFSASDAAVTGKNGSAAIEPSASLLAALASTLLEGKAGAALLNNVKDASAGTSVGLASGITDLTNVSKDRGISQPLQQVRGMCKLNQQHQQRVPAPQRGPSSRGSNSKSNNSKSSTTRNNKGSGARNSGRVRNSESAETKFVSEKSELVDSSAQGAAENGLVRGKRERSPSGRTAAPLKQQESSAPNNCVAHSNSFSTCCSEDFAELCTSGSSSSSLKHSHDGIRSVCGRVGNVQATFERAYTHDSYSYGSQTGDDVSICLQ